MTGHRRSVFEILTTRSENAGDGLLRLCWKEIMIEPIVLTQDSDGNYHFYSEALPYKTVIDTHSLPFGHWLKFEESMGRITIELDGRKVVYERIAVTPLDGNKWVCILRVGGANAEPG